jgi:hypothetical protein
MFYFFDWQLGLQLGIHRALIVAVFVEISISYVFLETATTYRPAVFLVFAAAGMLTCLKISVKRRLGTNVNSPLIHVTMN